MRSPTSIIKSGKEKVTKLAYLIRKKGETVYSSEGYKIFLIKLSVYHLI